MFTISVNKKSPTKKMAAWIEAAKEAVATANEGNLSLTWIHDTIKE